MQLVEALDLDDSQTSHCALNVDYSSAPEGLVPLGRYYVC